MEVETPQNHGEIFFNPIDYMNETLKIDSIQQIKSKSEFSLDKLKAIMNQSLESIFQNEDFQKQIPSIDNNRTLRDFKNQNTKLVKARVMIQNIFDPEIYLETLFNQEQFEIEQELERALQKNLKLLKYQDKIPEQNFQDFDQQRDGSVQEKIPCYCIPVPGENLPYWQEEQQNCQFQSIQPQELNNTFNHQDLKINIDADVSDYWTALRNKKIFNHNSKNKFGTIIKFYDTKDNDLKLNQIYQIYGILDYDNYGQDDEDQEAFFNSYLSSYPQKLVPTIHCVFKQQLDQIYYQEIQNKLENRSQNQVEVYELLMNMLNQITNDNLFSSFLLFSLFGFNGQPQTQNFSEKLIFNFQNIQKKCIQASNQELGFGEFFSTFFQKLCPKSLYLPLTIENLENQFFYPQKDCNSNALEYGSLQLTDDTLVLIDETTLQSGKLTQKGLLNLNSIEQILSSQKLIIDFNYYQLQFDCIITAIIFSEAKSLCKCNLIMPLDSSNNNQKIQLNQQLENLLYQTSAHDKYILNNIRFFILNVIINKEKVKLNEEISKQIESDYLDIKKEWESKKPNNNTNHIIDINCLNRWIILSKIMTAIYDKDQITFEIYKEVQKMDIERIKRLK